VVDGLPVSAQRTLPLLPLDGKLSPTADDTDAMVVDGDRDSKAKECERIVESVAAVASGQRPGCAHGNWIGSAPCMGSGFMTNDRGLCHPCSAATPRESPNAGDATLNVGFECAGCIHGGRRNHRAATRTTNKERNQGHDSVNARSPMASATDQTAAPYLHIGAVTDSGNLVDTDSIEVECIVSNGQLVSMRRRQLFDALHSGVATLDVLPATLDNAVCTTSRDTDYAAQVQELNASGNGAGAAGSTQGNVMPEQSPWALASDRRAHDMDWDTPPSWCDTARASPATRDNTSWVNGNDDGQHPRTRLTGARLCIRCDTYPCSCSV